MRTLRKLVLGETWTLPIAIGAAIGLAALLHAVAGGWWRSGGGFVLRALIEVAYLASTHTRRARRRRAPRGEPAVRGEQVPSVPREQAPAGESA